MIKIAHRGNIDGSNKNLENNPDYLKLAIDYGYNVETDIWLINEKFYLGHDFPKYPIDIDFLIDIKDTAWFHCKNYGALYIFSKKFFSYNFFWHENDDFTLTNQGYIWTYPGKEYGEKSILVDLDLTHIRNYDSIYGICTDYAGKLI